ncbi:T6SS phospholipase effector Tle1-like catalytic domain-containing protein [Luteimonas arsenica]|uniref:T6SS phospholipase effector Tle1-like catalytic domain-containing protein n=1 Tax=Luteimonas arsenica TaxID=1586242 RepID=UPI0010548D45|nr:DUF2235 domain-containing protein [Luteimonas arsenica]
MGGRKPDGVGTIAINAADLETYEAAQRDLSQMQVPVLYRSDNPDSYLYFATFDGSGQDVRREGEVPTNVGVIHEQVEILRGNPGMRIASGYVPGPGTQRNLLVGLLDNAFAFSYDDRIIDAYKQFARQAQLWLQQNPNAEIHIASIGYSRGATLIPGFARLVERHGILDPASLEFHKDTSGELVATSQRPPLVPPGRTAHAVALFDPVSTSLPRHYDLRLPSSVISGYSLFSRDELRWLFAHTSVIPDGVTPDGRFGRSTVAGAHSDVGGGNRLKGLEIRAGNVVIDYLNSLSDVPLLQVRALPDDPAMDVIHRSEQGMLGAYALGAASRGERYVKQKLCVVVDPCRDAMPRDEALAAGFEYRRPAAPRPEPAPPDRAVLLDDPAHPAHALFLQAREGVHALDGRLGRAPDAGSERLAAALAAAAHGDGLRSIDHVVTGRDGRRMFAIQGALHDPAQRRAAVDTVIGLSQPLAESTRRLARLQDEARTAPTIDMAQGQAQPPAEHRFAPSF